jgi:hypothetical protein
MRGCLFRRFVYDKDSFLNSIPYAGERALMGMFAKEKPETATPPDPSLAFRQPPRIFF